MGSRTCWASLMWQNLGWTNLRSRGLGLSSGYSNHLGSIVSIDMFDDLAQVT